MTNLNRRQFASRLAATTAGAAIAGSPFAYAQAKPKVVIVGGGVGGATVAHYLRKSSPNIEVTLIEPNERLTTCAGSNLYLGGIRTFEDLTHDFQGLKRLGVRMVRDRVTAIDTAKRSVTLQSGSQLPYDRLVVSPGIDFKYETVEGYSEAATDQVPHGWTGGRQTLLLKRQIEDMPDGGLVVIATPPGTYRCPPAPYERACMIALWLKSHQPKSKILLLESKKSFAKEEHFKKAFAAQYPGLIELRQSNEIDSFQVTKVDPKTRQIVTRSGEKIQAAVLNLIPAQKAGAIAFKAGLTDGDWCPVDPLSFESRKAKDVFVLGDAAVSGPMPKSAFSTNSQAKVVANAIEAQLVGKPKFVPRLRSTCWSILSRANTVKVGGSYAVKDGAIVTVNTFSSPAEESPLVRAKNTSEYFAWYTNLTTDTFAKAQ